MIQVEFRPAASRDLEKAAEWYESQYPGLGSQFLDEADHVRDRIAENPKQFPIVYRDARRALLFRFPYTIYFKLIGNRALVAAVADQRGDPIRWRRRI